ncbi:MAG: NYN domain-containing protein, partial [Polyangiaceae bacterium]|nr:NYN domain-containing protein [Polyangiaceae bacterium]
GDSDFSPLVSKLRENNKQVIGVGVKNSSSDLLIENCDDFIYYDDLVRERRKARAVAQKSAREKAKAETKQRRPETDDRPPAEKSGEKTDALELVLDTVEALFKEREGNLWGSMVKQVLKRKRPNFEESYYGYRTFNELLQDAHEREMLEIEKDSDSGGVLILAFGPKA